MITVYGPIFFSVLHEMLSALRCGGFRDSVLPWRGNSFALLTSPRPNPSHAHNFKAEGTEGEAESRLLRKLLKNQNRLIDSIRQMDVDRDGVISTAEFRAAIVDMNIGLSDRQVEKLIRSIDVDNDGELDMQVPHPRHQNNTKPRRR